MGEFSARLPVKIILRLNEGSDGILALRSARSLIRDGHRDCIYSFENGDNIYARRNKGSVTAYEESRP